MKKAMKRKFKLTTGVLAVALMVGGSAVTKAVAQNADAIDNARSTAKQLQQNPASPAPKPAPGAPAPAVKPATIPGSQPASSMQPAAKPAAEKPATVSSSSSSSHNQLQKVSVGSFADGFQIEISSSQSVTPTATKLSSPARIVVELPETAVASAQNKIPVGSNGVKGVRIGMDGKTPPTTSVVVDLEKPMQFELAPNGAGKLILTLHTGGAPAVAKNAPAPPAKNSAPAAKSVAAANTVTAAKAVPAGASVAKTLTAAVKPSAPAAKPVLVQANSPVIKAPASKPVAETAKAEAKQPAKAATGDVKAVAAKTAPAAKAVALDTPKAATASGESAAKPKTEDKPKQEEKKWAMNGKRDPFFSPVVQQGGSGCSTGKKCLEIGGINLRGVVKSDTGFIAVVTNNLNKAYFLRENDPVFNGFVVKITGDSVVFQETLQDKLGKSFTREVVKRIFTPAV